MNRRRALACVGSALFAGCLSESTSGGSDPSASKTSTRTRSETTTEQPLTRTAIEPSGSPTLTIPSDNHCPSFGDSEVVCSVDADPETTLQMAASSDRASLPKTSLSFTLTNDTGATFTTNYYAWSVSKVVDGEWFHIAPQVVPEPAMMLESGGSHAWNVTIDNTELDTVLEGAGGTEDVTVAGLGGGTYAFGIDGWFQGDGYENGIGVAARFELVGDELPLTPTADLEVVGRDGDEKHVRAGEGGETYVATRIENAATDARRVIPEQVIRSPLRNLLASFESGVRRVRLDMTASSPLFYETQLIAYDGETYRIERSNG